MTSSPESLLVELTNRFRANRGPAALADRGLLSAYLLGEAPELRPYIGALAAALAGGRVWQPRERATAALVGELAAEIVATEGVRADIADTAVRAALRIAQPGLTIEAAAPAMPAVPDVPPQPRGGWVGETVVAGSPVAPTATPAAAQSAATGQSPATGQPGTPTGAAKGSLAEVKQLFDRKDWSGLLRNRWVLGAMAALAVIAFMDDSPSPPPVTPPPPVNPPPAQPPAPPPRSQGPEFQTPRSQGPEFQTPRSQGPEFQTPRSQGPEFQTPTSPPVQPPVQGSPGSQGDSLPRLVDPNQGPLPQLAFRNDQGNNFIGFSLPSQQGDVFGIVMIPGQGWDGAMVAFHRPGSQQPDTASGPVPVRLMSGAQGAARMIRPQWQVDRLGIRDICIGFHQQRAQDVTLNGSTMCVYSADCARPIGCGQVP